MINHCKFTHGFIWWYFVSMVFPGTSASDYTLGCTYFWGVQEILTTNIHPSYKHAINVHHCCWFLFGIIATQKIVIFQVAINWFLNLCETFLLITHMAPMQLWLGAIKKISHWPTIDSLKIFHNVGPSGTNRVFQKKGKFFPV